MRDEERKQEEEKQDEKKSSSVDNDQPYDQDGQIRGGQGPNMAGWKSGAYTSLWQ